MTVSYTSKVCKQCAVEYRVLTSQIRPGHMHEFCSQACSNAFGCTDENKANISAASKKSPRHRSKHQRGEKNPCYKGGSLDKNGYRLINDGGKQFFEHRRVMERILGRKLLPEETVHHKNGQRADNRPENLELWSSRNPRGQRIEDKVEWAHSLLRQYGVPNRPFTASDLCMAVSCGF